MPSPSKPLSESAPCDGDQPALLLVEDSVTIRDLLAAFLRQWNYEVIACRNAENALECVVQHRGRIRLLITDIVLEKMSGRQLAERLREMHPELPVLFVSGHIQAARLPAFTNSIYLEKPFSLQVLTEAVETLLKQS